MKRTPRYILLLLSVALLVSVSMGCKKSPGLTTSATTSSTQLTTNPGQIGNTTVLPGGMPNIADMKSLSSYRYSIMTKMVEGAGIPVGSVDYMKYEYVKAQNAEHSWREDASGNVTEVYIKIGDRYWIWFGMAGMGWVEQPVQTTPTTSTLPSDFVSQLKQVQQDVANSTAHFDKKGTETVNNVRCTRYEFDYTLSTDFPNVATGGTTKIDTHSSGEMWIADQSGLPSVVIKSKNRTEINSAGDKIVMDSEQNLTDIGANIVINPPGGATTIPTGTTTTSTTTTATTTAATTTTTTTTASATPSLQDNFQGPAWNSNLTWTDPNDDVLHNFTAHPGFLRLTVPTDNDLARDINYDAPRLLVPQYGNFTLETLVEFDPQETYQGAGLLVWQNEDNFLRLEFGYGGMGGSDKNVVFVHQHEGNYLAWVGSVDVPESLTRIELRLQREGNQFTASYRQVGGTWQEIGSTEISLNSTVEIGIAQVTQYTSTAISADFDYIKIFTP
jgi:regulation of enolase protein 1 (concanavalin A-like superfamily)